MKRIAFYVIILLQVLFIAAIGWQNMLIDRYGETVQLRVEKNDYEYEYGWTYAEHLYVNYEINHIPKSLWDIENPHELNYNERVFVLLEPDDEGYYIVKKASTKKMKQSDNDLVVPAKYRFANYNVSEVNYGIETIHKRTHKTINHKKPYTVVVKVAPWGQMKIVEMQQD